LAESSVSSRGDGGGGDQPACLIYQELGPGWRFWGKTYEEWNALPADRYELPIDRDFSDDHPPPELTVPASRFARLRRPRAVASD
jgi:hypothetical protein